MDLSTFIKSAAAIDPTFLDPTFLANLKNGTANIKPVSAPNNWSLADSAKLVGGKIMNGARRLATKPYVNVNAGAMGNIPTQPNIPKTPQAPKPAPKAAPVPQATKPNVPSKPAKPQPKPQPAPPKATPVKPQPKRIGPVTGKGLGQHMTSGAPKKPALPMNATNNIKRRAGRM